MSCKTELGVIKYLNGFSCFYSKRCQTEARVPGPVRGIIITGTVACILLQYLTALRLASLTRGLTLTVDPPTGACSVAKGSHSIAASSTASLLSMPDGLACKQFGNVVFLRPRRILTLGITRI